MKKNKKYLTKKLLTIPFNSWLSQDKKFNKEVKMKTAVVYARYSSDSQSEQSIEG